MTPMQERFVQEYIVSSSAEEAAIKAGYSKNTARKQAYQLLHKPNVRKQLDNARRQINEAYIFSAKEKLNYLQKGISQCADNEKWREVASLTRVHNEMTGDNAPTKTVSVNVNVTLEEIKTLEEKYYSEY